MRLLALAFGLAWLVLAGCSLHGSSAAATSARTQATAASALAPAAGGFDAEIAMPDGFPSDVPIYPKARLTAAASFASSGQVAWGMEWQTGTPVDRVAAFYQKQFTDGDWTISDATDTNGVTWTANVGRKSNSGVKGSITVNNDQNVIRILLSLIYPA